MAVRFEDHSTEVLRRVQGNLKKAAIDVGDIARDAVQEKMLWGYHDVHGNPPHTEIVDTGRLFDSIEGQVKAVNANVYQTSVGTDVPYAEYVHEGTYKLKGRPFITDGIMENREEIQTAIREALRRGMT
jgi:HK97 gp10 family phage protein